MKVKTGDLLLRKYDKKIYEVLGKEIIGVVYIKVIERNCAYDGLNEDYFLESELDEEFKKIKTIIK